MELGGRNGTNSITNWLMSGTKNQPAAEVGMGATILCWTDRHAGTITKVWKERGIQMVEVQEDKSVRTDTNGMSESQQYAYEANPTGCVTIYGLTKKGWLRMYLAKSGRYKQMEGGNGLRIGERCAYRDFSF